MIPSRPCGKESVNAIVSKEYHHPLLMFNVQVQPSFHLTSALVAVSAIIIIVTPPLLFLLSSTMLWEPSSRFMWRRLQERFSRGPRSVSLRHPTIFLPPPTRGTVQRSEDLFIPSGQKANKKKRFVPSPTYHIAFPLVRLMSPTVPPAQVRCQNRAVLSPPIRSSVPTLTLSARGMRLFIDAVRNSKPSFF